MKKLGRKYESAVRDEVLTSLGERIHLFRNVSKIFDDSLLKQIPKDALRKVDVAYQIALDAILDGFLDGLEMKAHDEMFKGLRESMNIKRGFKKRQGHKE